MASKYFVDDMAEEADSEMESHDDDPTQCAEADDIIFRSQHRGATTRVIRSDDSDESETQGDRSHASYMDESHASSVGESSQIQEEVNVQDSQDSQRSQ